MCIRDSDRTAACCAIRNPWLRGMAFGAPVEPEVKEISAQSVSYTHLRAHETVLDLVCRLLLEKKKHKIAQHSLSMQQ